MLVEQHSQSGIAALVGRLSELHALDAAWVAANAGQGGIVLLTGEAGIGKTDRKSVV